MAGGKNGKNGGVKTQTALGFEATLWAAADKLRSNMDADTMRSRYISLSDSDGRLGPERPRPS